ARPSARFEDPPSAGARHELLESGVLPDRIERRVDLEPPGTQVVWDPEQRLELVQRLLLLPDHDVDPSELELIVGPAIRVLRERGLSESPLSLPHRFVLLPLIGKRDAQE